MRRGAGEENGQIERRRASEGEGFRRERLDGCRRKPRSATLRHLRAITWRYTSSTQSRDALRVQPRLRGETTSPPLSKFSLSLSHTLIPYDRLSPSANPVSFGLSLSRQMATITYMCQYITHTASRRALASPLSRPPLPASSTKCTTTSRPFTLSMLSSDIAPSLSTALATVIVRLFLSHFSRLARTFSSLFPYVRSLFLSLFLPLFLSSFHFPRLFVL